MPQKDPLPGKSGLEKSNQMKNWDLPVNPFTLIPNTRGIRDILWGKQVWERMDLDERFNLPLYHPTDTLASMPNVRSLFDALYHGISSGKITKIYIDSYFTQKLTLDEIKERMSAINITDIVLSNY